MLSALNFTSESIYIAFDRKKKKKNWGYSWRKDADCGDGTNTQLIDDSYSKQIGFTD